MQHNKKKILWLSKDQLFAETLKVFKESEIVLDIGSGIMPQNYIKPMVHICCEPFNGYVVNLQKKIENHYDRNYVIVRATWAEAIKIFPPKSIDSIFLIDVVEHLRKKEALQLIKESEKIARKQIAIFTPLGFIPQKHDRGKDAWGLSGGKWQEHKSGWEPEDFDSSWNIYACKSYHYTNNMGKALKKPHGAFWAIKNIQEEERKKKNIAFKTKAIIFQIYRQTIELNNLYALRFISKLMILLMLLRRLMLRFL